MENNITSLLERAIVAALKADALSTLAGYAIRAGHAYDPADPTLEGKTRLVTVTATRPRRWLEDGDYFHVDLQVRALSDADQFGFTVHDAAVAALSDYFGPEAREDLCARLSTWPGLGVNTYEDTEPRDEARDPRKGRHGEAFYYTVDCYLRPEELEDGDE